MNLSTLKSLQSRIREATDPDRELDGDILVAIKGGEIVWKTANYTMEQYPAHRYASKHHLGGFANEHVPHLTGSLDACRALAYSTLSIFWVRTDDWADRQSTVSILCNPTPNTPISGTGATLCLAYLDAICAALIAEEEAKEKADV